MNRLEKRRIDNTRKPRLMPVYEFFDSGAIVKLGNHTKTKHSLLDKEIEKYLKNNPNLIEVPQVK